VFHAETDKSIVDFVKDLGKSMAMHGFVIHNDDKMEMVHHFGHHGAELAEGFDLCMVQICEPKRSAKSMMENLERAVLLPKFIIVFTENNRTQVRMLRLSQELIAELVADAEFPAMQQAISDSLITAIEEAL
ncbi:MAG: DUF302 domain-containing protein, partial [Desulfuromusa sp.]|nr:DUF302 domain-containing protein [Desulfuromusa sp.]